MRRLPGWARLPRWGSDRRARAAAVGPLPLLLSAGSEETLRGRALELAGWLRTLPPAKLADAALALAALAPDGDHRAAVVAADREDLLSGLEALATGAPSAHLVRGSSGSGGRPAFVFPGQGGQWIGMGVELLDTCDAFRQHMEAAAAALAPHYELPVIDLLRAEPEAPTWWQVAPMQLMLWAMSVALADTWRSFGVEPGAVVGHSLGEIPAAYVAGAMSLEDNARLAAAVARVYEEGPKHGGMAAITIEPGELRERLRRWQGKIEIGGINGPRSCVVSGDADAVQELVAELEADGVRALLVAVGGAPHSHHADVLRELALVEFAPIGSRPAGLPFYSGVEGDLVNTATFDAAYWFATMRQTVLFESAVRAALGDGLRTFVEISPHPIFGTPIGETGEAVGASALGTLRREQGGMGRLLTSMADAWVHGVEVDWRQYLEPLGAKRIELPAAVTAEVASPLGPSAAPAAEPTSLLGERMRGLPEPEQERLAVDLVRSQLAAVLGLDEAGVDDDLAFRDLGFDSASVAELRNRLAQSTGLDLPAAVAFDYPTVGELAGHLRLQALGLRAATETFVAAGGIEEEPIAIVGIACRFPGGVASAEGLWGLLEGGGDAISEFPEDRGWDLAAYAEATAGHADRGGFLHEAGAFDPAFFGISPREALAMDPQQRLLLEGAWEALEDGGVDPAGLRGSDTGVFVGVSSQDYGPGLRGVGVGDADAGSGGQELMGTLTSLVSGRLAYTLGLEGPTLTLDTACSSSLVAMHLAAQALRAGECGLALAGGVTVLATPGVFIGMARQGGLAPDGRCKSFSAEADGTGWSEGSGLLLLERLSNAERNGRRILAVIKGSATNQDGASNGLTAPNGPSQERVIRQALANAGLKPSEVDAVEAHGTGTTLGDPIEAGALLATYGQERDKPLALGSLKSNIGHTQAAAGVGGVIKMVMALREEALPRTLHVSEPTPHVDWSAGEIELLTEQREWPKGGRPRRAGISSFGISGTNAHLIIEEAPEQPAPEKTTEAPPLLPYALSAKTPEALSDAAGRLAAHLEAKRTDSLDVAHTLLSARAQLEQRAVIVAEDEAELLQGLDALARGKGHENLVQAKKAQGPLAFLLSGQGSQRAQMGKGLYEAFPVYAESFDSACDALAREGIEVKEAIWAEPGTELSESLGRTDLTQASLFALQVSLFALVDSFGQAPDYLLGHSVGEITAAHLAGVFSLEDAARLIAARGRLMAALPEGGAMAFIAAGEAEVEASLQPYKGRLTIAAVNSPTQITVSGEEDALTEWEAAQAESGREAKRLRVSHAFHSHRMEPMLAEFEEVAATLTAEAPKLPVISNRTGEPLTAEQVADPSYWAGQVRGEVRFADGLAYLQAQGTAAYLELGPAAVLSALAAQEDPGKTTATALRHQREDARSFLLALGAMHACGQRVDFEGLFKDTGARITELPTYPFQRERYWVEATRSAGDLSAAGQSSTEHPLLGASVSLADGSHLFTGRISQKTHPWLAEHAVAGTAILPGTAFVEIALRAGQEVGAAHLQELILEAPLAVPEEGAVQLQVTVSHDAEEQRVEIHARIEPTGDGDEEPPWARHASATLTNEPSTPLGFDATAWPPAGAEPLDTEDLYERVAEIGLEYGPAFQGLEAAWKLGEEIYAEISLAEEQGSEAGSFGLHPALLDAALHAALLDLDSGQAVRLPFGFAGVSLHGGGPSGLRVRLSLEGERIRLEAADQEGNPAVSVAALSTREVDPAQLRAAPATGDGLFRIEWERLELDDGEEAAELHRCIADPDLDPAAASHALCAEVLERLQAEIAAEEPTRLAFLTEGAMALDPGKSPDPALASVWGLVRSAQSEHPGRFLLIDSDGTDASEDALAAALTQAEEPQLALREGTVRVPRLRGVGEQQGEAPPLGLEGTVLITGGLSGLGALTAEHLAGSGAEHLLLVSRRGPDAPGAAELVARLAELGCAAEAVACDVADAAAVGALLAGIPDERPLSAVVHSAGSVEDGTIESLNVARLDAVLAPKADAAWHLHEATRGMDLAAFVLFSSAAASFGSPGQGNYAAANSFLDALAARRHGEGLPATAVAWGAWDAGMSAELGEADRARVARLGLLSLDAERGLGLLDRARSAAEPFLVAAEFDAAALRTAAGTGLLPPLFAGLARTGRRRAKGASGSLARRLAAVPAEGRQALVVALVREHAAGVLGHAPEAIDPGANFKDLGFDSLGAVELRNRLTQATEVQLDATLVFDYPTAEALAGYLLDQVEGTGRAEVAVRAARGSDEPVAIVGLSCRYPGGVASAEGLWELLAVGGDGTTEFPADRGWDVEGIYDPDPDHGGTTYARRGGFLHGAAEFDPEFFGISPREALAMDPQQRLLLEGAWEALEDAGIDPGALRGSATGVFAGLMHHDYAGGAATAPADLEGHFTTGISGSVVSGRVAYELGLEGPAVTIDTACSSSLVAMHLAAQALRGGECDLALAGGVTTMATPNVFIGMSRQRGLAPDGRCKSFSAEADGTGWSEGSGLLLLERLSDAERNGRRILAVIKGSATNQDGASNGLTAPNGPSQERVIRQALANAGLKPSEVDAVEAHGTGTTLGDPIEAGALLATYGQERETPLQLGSLKSNIGHTQAAAGVGGVIKMVMALREEALPKTLHVSEPTPHVDWSAGEIELLTEQREWPKGDRPRRAGISSFGISGTNAHLIIEEAPEQPQPEKSKEAPPLLPFALSAKSPEALADAAGRLAAHLEAKGPERLDVAHTLIDARAQLEQRAVIVAGDEAELLAGLDALAQGKSAENLVQAKKTQGPLAFLLSGQGSQRPQMGKGLYEAFPVYAEAFDSACDALASEGIEVKEAIWASAGTELSASLERTDLTQASLFALQTSLFALVGSFGLSPDYLLGHSVGEITAAHLAGVFSLEDAAKLIAARGRLMAALPEGGAMAFIAATEAEVEESLTPYEGRLTIAAVNSPTQITVSGDEDALAEWEATQAEGGKEARRLRVSHAFHSHRMEPMLREFEEVAATLSTSAPKLPVISNRTGEPLTPEQAVDPAYWAGQVRGEVRFADGLAYLQSEGTRAYLELGPAAVLSALAAQESPGSATATALRHKRDDAHSFLLALGAMHACGQRVDFTPLFEGTGARVTQLPTYPFQRERYWLQAARGSADFSAAGQSATGHPLLVASVALADGSHLLTGRLSPETHPWLAEHAVAGTAILPGTAFVELALRAGVEVGATNLEELILEAPLAVPEEGAVQLQVTVSPDEEAAAHRVEIHARPEPSGEAGGEEAPWSRHVTATLSKQAPLALDFDATAWPPPGAEPLDTADLYDRVAAIGLEYGPAFQGLEAAWRLGEEIYAEISLAPEQEGESGSYRVHPALLDAAMHAAFLGADPDQGASVPFSFAAVSIEGDEGPTALRVRISLEGGRLRLQAADQDGIPVAEVEVMVRPLELGAEPPRGDALFAIEWERLELGDGEEAAELHRCTADPDLDPAAASHALCAEVLERLQVEIAAEEPTRLAFLTEGAMALDPGESPDPALASVWGLVRSAQSEHPGRFLLIDTDGTEASEGALAAALAQTEEPQLALREGTARAPRLARAGAPDPESEGPLAAEPEGTVLITGGLSGLGALTARHLAEQGAKHLLLTSRRGPDAPGAGELVAALGELGCTAEAVACDVADAAAVEALLAAIPAERPLTAVVHSAGVLGDGTIESLDPARLDAVLAPKADAAWNLHEATKSLDLAAFVLFSSAAAALGAPGQGNYAAANSFLDALAARRRAEGLPATAIAWSLWEEGGMGAELGEADRARLARTGLVPISTEEGFELLGRAQGLPAALSLAVPLDLAVLRGVARLGMLPPIFSGLVKVNRRRAKAASGSLARRLAAVPAEGRPAVVLAAVREQVAGVLGHASGESVDPAASFKDLGFDSLGAVELRNRLTQATGVQLDATLVFDYPTAEALAGYLLAEVEGEVGAAVAVRASHDSDEPIAIVGISCRYPGGVASPRDLWGLLAAGGDGIGEFPADRGWDVEGIYDPDPERTGTTYTRQGGFLREAAEFDPDFFGISPREALAMDPQQRLLLEGAWEALEDAGIDPAALRGSDTGVFAGMMASGYGEGGELSELEGFAVSGLSASVASGRVAYALGLEGPAVTIDTACSSSLVAMHLAAQALRAGECGLALAGGVMTIAAPGVFIGMSRQRGLAPDGRCKSFSAEADGTGWSEGSGLLLLERLSDAERNGRRILAVIKGSATNQDGASNGLTAPNGPSQERVIRQALANAGLKPSEVDAVEAHGTGTTLGDPIEAGALLATYGQERETPLALGSLKSNIGHTQAAAGVGGVIKMVMALREEALPRTLHVSEPTPHVDWSAGEIELLTEQRPWLKGERPRRAGISSFGISGTNAHLIIEEAPEQPVPEKSKERPPLLPFALSAKSTEALSDAAGRLAAHVEAEDPDPLDVAYTLLGARAQLEQRAVIVAGDGAELLAGLDALAQGKPAESLVQAKASAHAKTVFCFPGQGSQWMGMASELLDESPLFAEQIERCEQALAPYLDTPLIELLRSEDEQWLSRVELVQPALFAVMVALAELWRSHGVEPAAVVGHSQGEIAAAVVAGALTLDDGAKLAALRARSLTGLMAKGEMASVQASAEEIGPHLDPYSDRVSIAAHNGPRATVLSGEPEAIEELIAHFEAEGTRARLIPVGYASHCAQIEAIEDELKKAIGEIVAQDSAVPFYSTLTGEPIQTSSLDGEYWYRNLREPVRFRQATERLLQDGHSAFVEVSAHPVLALALSETAEAEGKDQTAILHTLRRDEGDSRRLLTSLAAAHAHGVPVDFSPLFEGTGARLTELPTYPFQRRRYWLEASRGSGDASALGQASTEHPLLGASVAVADGSQLLTGRISRATHPWLAEHAVAGTAILPGTAFVELALRAGQEVGATHLAELILESPLPIPGEGAVQLQVTDSQDEEEHRVEIHARPEPSDGDEETTWARHASATLCEEAPAPLGFDATAWPPAGAEPLAVEDLYERLADTGLEYGPAFQGLEAAWRLGEEIYAEVSLASEQEGEAGGYGVHPALLDAALHPAFLETDPSQGARLPFSFSGVSLNGAEGPTTLRVKVTEEGEKLRLEAADAEGNLAARVESLATREVDAAQLGDAPQADALFGIEWSELELPEGGEEVEQVRVHRIAADPGLDPAEATHQICAETLCLLQEEIAGENTSRLAFLTAGAMALDPSESPDPALASVWGLVRSAQSEHPGRFTLIDTDGSDASEKALTAGLRVAGEPQLALREGVARVPRLVRAAEAEELVPPARPWRLAAGHGGTIEALEAVAAPEATRPLGADEVRVEVHAAGLNFRDVLIALGMYPVAGTVGGEGAGVVLEVGSGVDDLRPGDHVFGLLQDAFGPVAVAGRGMLARLPDTWSFAEGAAVPIVACTAYYGLRDLADLQAGERVLVHAGAGGVGTVAIGIAQHLGAEVFATASPGKWEALRGLGLDDDHIASSRDLDFRDKFLEVTGGEGMDVVLDSLAKEFVDASLHLLPRGGRFLEMGKTDVRDPEQVAAEHPGVVYRDYDLFEAGTERLQAMFAELLELYQRGALRHGPIAAWDVRDAKAAFRHLSQARHVGKLVLRLPRDPDPEGTVLVTGGLSGIGALTAKHLAAQGARYLLLTSRRGAEAPGAAELVAELAELGCEATAVACDVADRAAVEALVASVPAAHPLTAVVHSAGLLDDGTIESLDPDRLDAVLAPKAAGAWNLHEATRGIDLAAFVLYSSAAASFGSPGQGNYAAANAFLDGLAARRRAEGLPATAIAWGLWEQETEATGHLGDEDRARLERAGISLLGTAAGLELFDRARDRAAPLAVAAPLQPGALRAAVGAGLLPPLFSGLVRGGRRRAGGASGSLARRLAGVPAAEREEVVLALVREHAAVVLGHASAEAIDPAASFKDLGFDSLGAVELRNRLGDASGARLDATLVFDYPTPAAVAGHLLSQVEGTSGGEVVVHAARGSDEPIAIVGMSCRFPGDASSPARLWDMVAAGRDGIGPFPADRGWDLNGLYDADPERAGRAYAREGGFLRETTEFDPGFFGISPREALAMDPQQRLLLEGAWEALEDAGIDPAELRGSDTGVFAGAIASDYLSAAGRDAAADLEGHAFTGVPTSVASGRIAYALGLEGPAMTIDTACSSSLVAMHLAAQALRGGECELALAGGVTTMATPGLFISTSRQRALSVAGRCKSFSAEADGAGFSEGSGLLLLERLSDAQRNGRRILAVIKGSATNQDGASNGLTAPNGPSQERVIRQALANAGLKPSEVDAVEAHGTGTTLGDPIEAGALLATYGQEREAPLQLGSLKSNIGHTQAAAGVGGVIKMVMALREEALPKTLHVSEPTPHVDWSAGEIELLTEARPWPKGEKPRRAGISSFGISGTNAHLILEEAPEQPQPEKTKEAPPLLPFALSGKTPEALSDAAGRLAAHIEAKNPERLDVAHTLLSARAQLEQRAVIVAADQAELLAGLDALAQGKPAENHITAKASAHAKTVFCFPGQGSQWLGMASEFLDESPLFAEQIERCEQALAPYLDTPLTELLRSEDEQWLSRVELVQPALFAVMVALAELWRSYGVEPAAVVGHSQGEIAAAVIAGALSLEDGAKLAALRARSLVSLMGKGEMASVQASAEEVEPHLAPYADRVSIAAHNGPRATVLSGEPEAIAELIERFESEGTRARLIPVGYASHCAQIEAIEEELKEAIGEIVAGDSATPFYSTLTGEPLDTSKLDAEYWYRNLREPVRFHQATERLLQDGHSAFVEISAHPVLALALSETAEAQGKDSTAILHTLRRDEGDARRMLTSLAAAHAHGIPVDFAPLFEGTGARLTELPTYPFQRRRYWLEASKGSGDASSLGQASTEHPLLGAALSLAGEGTLLTGRISQATHPWLAEHAVAGTSILPGTAFIELALRAGVEVGATNLEELILEAPLPIPEEGAVQLQVTVSEDAEEQRVEIHARTEPSADQDEEIPWARHASATLTDEAPAPLGFDATAWPPAGAEALATEDLYERVADLGLEYGPAFQGLEAAWKLGEEIYAEVSLAPEQEGEAGSYGVHPALLDAALHPAFLDAAADAVRLPFAFNGVALHAPQGPTALRVRLAPEGEKLSLQAADAEGNPVLGVESLATREVDPAQLGDAPQADALFAIEWSELELAEGGEEAEPVRVHRIAADPDLDPAEAAHQICAEALQLLQEAIAGEVTSRLAFLTAGAMALDPSESADPALASVWGLVRSAQSEHPGHFVLVDTDGSEASERALPAALQIAGEPQLALREGAARVPRLVPTGAERAATAPGDEERAGAELDPDGTVLVTGGLSGLGALTARHLAEQGSKHLLLTSRRGPEAPGATELIAELAALGCEADAVACDVSDKAQVEALIVGVSQDHPLTAVVHSAGALDDATIESLDASRLDAVLAPKADAAWHLHEATRGLDLAAFVFYSSAAATFGAPGQGNYAAANGFLDALAQRRGTEGLAATAVAWGPWEGASELVTDADRERLARSGLESISVDRGLELLDRTLALRLPFVVAAPLRRGPLRSAAEAGVLPPLLSGLVGQAGRRSRAGAGAFARHLASVPAAEREAAVLGLVREQIATVLGHASPESVDPTVPFKDLGFDSLGAVELRNRLSQASGVRLEATLVFDYPTPAAVSGYLLERMAGTPAGPSPVQREFDRLEAVLAAVEGAERDQAAARLRLLNDRIGELLGGGDPAAANGGEAAADIALASDDELFELIDKQLGADPADLSLSGEGE